MENHTTRICSQLIGMGNKLGYCLSSHEYRKAGSGVLYENVARSLHLLMNDVYVAEKKGFGLHRLSLQGLEQGNKHGGDTSVNARQGVLSYSNHCLVGA